VIKERPRFLAQYDTIFAILGLINNVQERFENLKISKVSNPKVGKFNYPVAERRTRDTATAMRAAEAALDVYWKTANNHWLYHVGTTPMVLIEHIIRDRVIQRTSPWAEPAPATISTVSKGPTLVKLDPFSGHQHDASKHITGNFKKLAVASKEAKKTHRQGADGGVEATNADNSPGGSEGFTIAVTTGR
jgi:hypothetical protein